MSVGGGRGLFGGLFFSLAYEKGTSETYLLEPDFI